MVFQMVQDDQSGEGTVDINGTSSIHGNWHTITYTREAGNWNTDLMVK